MPSIQELEQALIEADKAGDTEAATALAGDMERLMSAPEQPKSPGIMDVIAGKHTIGEFASGRMEDLKTIGKQIIDPKTWANLPNDLQKAFPMDPKTGKLTPEANKKLKDLSMNLVLSTMPVSKMTSDVKELLKPSVGAEVIKQQTLKNAGKAGYHVPAQQVKPGKMADLGERFAGKQGVEATARGLNQPVTNKLANKALGLADDVPLTKEVLFNLRTEAGKAYETVSKIGTLSSDKAYIQALRNIQKEFSGASKDFPELASQQVSKLVKALAKKEISSEGAVEMVKNLRQLGNSNITSSIPADRLLGKAQREAAEALDDLIERNIEPALGKELLDAYRAARVLISKTYVVEKALNPSTGNVIATEISKQTGKKLLTDELKEIAEFAKAFPKSAAEPLSGPPTGGLLEAMAFSAAGKHMTGSKIGAFAGLIPLVGKPLARRMMTTIPETIGQPLLGKKTEFLQRSLLAAQGNK